MGTTVVRPHDPELRAAVRLAAVFALLTMLYHLAANLWQAHIGYGYFRDEFYYLMCGRRLAWGYVDHGPLVAVQARVAETLFGHSLAGLRALASLGGGCRVLLTGLLAWALGGRRPAQALAMLCVALAPQYLALDSFLSMNSWESAFWMTCLLALVLIERGRSRRWWLAFGIAGGLGLLNKPSMTFFLLALLGGLLLTPLRRLLATRWAAFGVLLLFLIVLPNILWQMHLHWPTWEFLRDGQIEHKNRSLSPLPFWLTQIMNLNPMTILVWGAGLVWLLRRERWRWLGVTWLLFGVGMMALHAKDYYVVPIYPVLLAAGGIAWEQRFARSSLVHRDRWFAFPVFESLLLLSGIVLLPMSNPLLRPEAWLAYTRALHLTDTATSSENAPTGPLPQFYADRFGWQELVDQVAKTVATLSPEDRAKVRILCANYGEAGALEFLGHDLPPVISGHNNYYFWGPRSGTGEVMILVYDTSIADLQDYYADVERVGGIGTKYAMPHERDSSIYLARHRKRNLSSTWAEQKHFD
jgi:hypothetical protein